MGTRGPAKRTSVFEEKRNRHHLCWEVLLLKTIHMIQCVRGEIIFLVLKNPLILFRTDLIVSF